MNIQTFLHSDREACPPWLKAINPESAPPLRDFLDSRTVFYPGCGSDGHAFRVFAGAHAAHCFVLADYGVPREMALRELGYRNDGSHTEALCHGQVISDKKIGRWVID